jgi:hypothetical protein
MYHLSPSGVLVAMGQHGTHALWRFGDVNPERGADFREKTSWHATCHCGRQRFWRITPTP